MSFNTNTRELALKWWRDLTNEEKFFEVVSGKELILGYPDRTPDSLTGREIEVLYKNKFGYQ